MDLPVFDLGPTISLARNQIQLLMDAENVYTATVENLKARKRPSDTPAATEFILARIADLVDYLEDTCHLQINVGYYYLTGVGQNALRSRGMLFGFLEQLRQLGIGIRGMDKGQINRFLESKEIRLSQD